MIYGERIRLRGSEHSDLPAFTRWINDPEIQEGITVYQPMSLATEEQWFTRMIERPLEERVMVIEARSENDWQMIGNCALFELDWRTRSTEFGILIGEKSCWNQGYGTETVRLLARHVFQTLNLNRLYLRVYANNTRAIRAYEKAGFQHEGRLRQAEFRHGQYIDLLVMSLLRAESGF